MKKAVVGGVIAGLLTILIYFLVYQVSKEAMLSMLVYVGTGIIYLLAMLGVVLLWKNQHQGIISFKKGVQLAFVCFLIANIFYHGFNFYLFNSDPELAEIQHQMMLEMIGDEAPTVDQEQNNEAVQQVGIGQVLSQYTYKSIFGFLIALLIGWLAKQEK